MLCLKFKSDFRVSYQLILSVPSNRQAFAHQSINVLFSNRTNMHPSFVVVSLLFFCLIYDPLQSRQQSNYRASQLAGDFGFYAVKVRVVELLVVSCICCVLIHLSIVNSSPGN